GAAGRVASSAADRGPRAPIRRLGRRSGETALPVHPRAVEVRAEPGLPVRDEGIVRGGALEAGAPLGVGVRDRRRLGLLARGIGAFRRTAPGERREAERGCDRGRRADPRGSPHAALRYWLMCQPPFGDSTWPVTKADSSLAR